MNGHGGKGFTYTLTGMAVQERPDAYILNAQMIDRQDYKTFIEFGLRAPKPGGAYYNGVFYIPTLHPKAGPVANVVVEALVKQIPLEITFVKDKVWDPECEPGGYVIDAKLVP